MSRGYQRHAIDRRTALKLVAAGGVAGLAGCAGDGGDSDDSGSDGQDELGDTLVGPDDEPVTLKFVYRTGTDTGETTAQFMAQELAKIGIDVEFDSAPFNTLLDRYASNKTPDMEEATFNAGDRDEAVSAEPWDLLWGIGFNTYPRTPTAIAPFFIDERDTASSTINFYGYRPSDGRDLKADLDRISVETDQDARQELLAELFGYLSEEQPFGMVAFGDDINGFRSNVAGYDAGASLGYQSQRWYFSDNGGGSSPAGAFISGEGTDAQTLNPIRISDVPSSDRVALTMDSAYTFDNDVEFVGRWIESVETDDQQTFEFTLRENLRWSEPYGQMTAEDWVYWITQVRQGSDERENWAGDTNFGDFFVGEEPMAVEQTGTYTFEIALPDVDPDFVRKPIMWGEYCMPKGLLEPYVDDRDGDGLNQDEEVQSLSYTGNLGPYAFDRWDRESRFAAVRNEDYYLREVEGFEDAPLFEESAYQVFGEESTRLSALETGEITYTLIPPERAQRFEESEDVDVVLTPTPFISVLAYNQRANGWEGFRSKAVRQAFAYAINKRTIAEDINRGYATPAHTYQPEYSLWFDDSEVTRTGVDDSHSYAKAKQLIDDALDDYKYV